MKKKIMGFTLLELVIVIIIIGILATLGFAQFSRMIERSRGAEARSVAGSIRTQAAAIWAERNIGGLTVLPGTFNNIDVGIGTTETEVSSGCANPLNGNNYYFSYNIAQNGANNGFVLTAQRCIGAAGKQPGGPVGAGALTLTTNFATGTDTWAGAY